MIYLLGNSNVVDSEGLLAATLEHEENTFKSLKL